ncbi:MAG: hypothetical protein KAU21_11425 [Gammaproteobacteria bacterium]|nr:hypothetical protein [Gammaproteobacteria bacterium]
MDNYLVIDQGTHASRCIIYDSGGQILAQAEHPLNVYRQDNGFIEQNAEEILASIYFSLDQIRQHQAFENITAAALITQRSTIVGWDKQTGKALSAAISWQDTRAADSLQPLENQLAEIQKITGLVLSPHYGASKIKWLIDNNEDCRQAYQNNGIIIAPLACYLIRQLTSTTGAYVDHVNASRTQLFDINKLNWSQTMLDKFDLNRNCLPETKPCLSDYGMLRHHNIPLKLVSGDQNAAIFANGLPDTDTILVNIGSGAFVLKITEKLQKSSRLLNGLAVTRPDNNIYLQEGTVNGAGSAIDTLFDEINEEDFFKELPQWISSVQLPPIFINTISGLGSPWWNKTIQPHYLNYDQTETSKEISLPERAVAMIESIAFLLQNNIELLADADSRQIYISGGLSNLDGLCQKLADLSGFIIKRFANTEASATGAAWLLANSEQWQLDITSTCFKPEENKPLKLRYQAFTQRLTFLTGINSDKGTTTK